MFDEISSTTFFIYLIVLLLSVISITLLVLLVHSGLFNSVKEVGTRNPPLGKVVIAYKFQKGPYNEAGQIFTEATIIAPDNKCLGIYYDDPRKVSSADLRYAVGSILASDPADVDADMLDRFTQKGYKMITLPEVEFVVHTSFPHVTTLSILIGIQKAYPRLAQYVEDHKLCAHPFLEYYDGTDIHFVAPLSKQEEFWVSECQEEVGEDAAETSDVNTTLDTSHSVLDDSTDDRLRETPDATHKPAEVKAVEEKSGNGDEGVVDKAGDVGVGEGIGGGKKGGKEVVEGEEAQGGEDAADDEEDNSSSSSFEVLKNDA